MSNLTDFIGGSSGTLVHGTSTFVPTAPDLITSGSQNYLRTGKIATYNSATESALVGTELANTSQIGWAGGWQKMFWLGKYEYWASVPLTPGTSTGGPNGLTRHSYYRRDTNGIYQLMVQDPIFLSLLPPPFYYTSNAVIDNLGVMRSGSQDQLFIRFISFETSYGTGTAYYVFGVFTSQDGFNWQFTTLQTTSASTNIIICNNTSAADTFCAASFGTTCYIYDFHFNLITSVSINSGTQGLLIGPDGVLYPSSATIPGFWNAGTGVATSSIAAGTGDPGLYSDVNEKTWWLGANGSVSATYYRNVGAATTFLTNGQTNFGLGSGTSGYYVQWIPSSGWWATANNTTSPTVAYNTNAGPFTSTNYTWTTIANTNNYGSALTSANGSMNVSNAFLISNPGLVNGLQFINQSSAFTGINASSVALGLGSALAYISGTYYSCVLSTTMLLMFSSTDLNTWTYQGLTTTTNSYLTIFKVANGVLWVSDGAHLWSASTVNGQTLSGVTITGTSGQFSCTASTNTLVVGQQITINGTNGGTGTISGYTSGPTPYYIIATNGSTTFQLSTTLGGSGVTTTTGTPTGLTYNNSSFVANTLTVNGATSPLSYDIDFFNSKYIVVGTSSGTLNNWWTASSAGGTWTGQGTMTGSTANVYRVADNGTTCVVTTDGTNNIAWSTTIANNASFTAMFGGVGTGGNGPFYIFWDSTNSRFVTVSATSTQCATSAAGQTQLITGVVITDTTGDFTCTAVSTTLAVGQAITITGTFGGTGSISGYASGAVYYIIATNGTTSFTLSASYGGTHITTTAGTPTGLTYTNGSFAPVIATFARTITTTTGATTNGAVPMYMAYKNGTYYLSSYGGNTTTSWDGIVYTSTDLAAWYPYNIQGLGVSIATTTLLGYGSIMNPNGRVFITSVGGLSKDYGIIEDNGNVPLTVGLHSPVLPASNSSGSVYVRIT